MMPHEENELLVPDIVQETLFNSLATLFGDDQVRLSSYDVEVLLEHVEEHPETDEE